MNPYPLFMKAGPKSDKVMCVICGAKGYGSINPARIYDAQEWQRRCMRGHNYLCYCGKRFANATAIASHAVHTRGGTHYAVRSLDGRR